MLRNDIYATQNTPSIQNNHVYNTEHYYAFILKDLKSIKLQTEKDAKTDASKVPKLNEVYEMYYHVIAGILREGVNYVYCEDAENIENSIIKIKIDNVEYDCLNTGIKNVLKDDYEVVMGMPYRGPEITHEANIAEQQIKQTAIEAANSDSYNSNFTVTPIAFKYEQRKKKMYRNHAIVDVIEVAAIILVFKIMMHNPYVNNVATYIYMLLHPYVTQLINLLHLKGI